LVGDLLKLPLQLALRLFLGEVDVLERRVDAVELLGELRLEVRRQP
jgi:hypothetical protein